MFDLKDKVAVVTGGAKGIGAAVVKSFLKEGAKFVAFLDIDDTTGLALERDLLKIHDREAVKFFKCDVTKEEELFYVYNYMVEHYGYIDVVINNAGIANDAIYQKEIAINFTSLVTSTLKALEMMRKDRGGNGGTVINISSIGAIWQQKEPTVYVYAACKSAVLMFSITLGMEAYYSHTGVRVITMCFGMTSTDILEEVTGIDDISTAGINNAMKGFKAQTPQVAANGVVQAYKNGATGSTWLVTDDQILDITERVKKGYQVMSGEIEI